MPIIQSGLTIWTFADAVEYVLDQHDIDRTGLNQRRARYAVLQAYSQLPQRHAWSYYIRQRLLQTVASYDTGTLAYDHTGGANERQMTLSGGTWPSWAAFGRLIIGQVHYEVNARISDTIITLTETSNPGSDTTASSYTLYRNAYPLPVNFKEFCEGGLCERSEQYDVQFVGPTAQFRALQDADQTPSTPRYATVRTSGDYLGSREIVFGPPPNAALTYDLLFHALPRPLNIDDYSAATVSVTSGDATVTGGTGVTFPTNCVGSIIRLADGASKPSGPLGGMSAGDNQFVLQGVIAERTDSTHVELAEAPTQSLTNVGYIISDPLDLDPNVMLTAFLRHAEAEFARLMGRDDYKGKYQFARQSLLEAMEADASFDNGGGDVAYDPFKYTTIESE